MYSSAFPGPDEVKVKDLPLRETLVLTKLGHIASFIVLRGNVLEYLVVNEEIRGKGIGSYAMERLLSLLRSRGIKKLYMECLPHLIGYYKRFGGKEMVEGRRVVYNIVEPHARIVIDV